jgi:hypothetical protein
MRFYMTSVAIALSSCVATSAIASPSLEQLSDALSNGTTYGDFRLRYESIEQDAADATALTLRTRLGYRTKPINGFSATAEFEDTRIVAGQGDYTVGPTGYNIGQHGVIADPEVTELDQAFLQFKNELVVAKFGRQVLTFDNHRFIGHVGWRQDRQTYDGVSATFSPAKGLTASIAYLSQRNGIFATARDADAKDFLLNLGYKTSHGKLSAYSYLLDTDDNIDNSIDTFGLRFAGSSRTDIPLSYVVEYATQDAEAGDRSADYLSLELAASLKGLKATLGQETLGSDGGNYTFATPLATLHKFNGWADIFIGAPTTGIVDTYLSLGGKAAGGNWLVAYHQFDADEGSADHGSEFDILYKRSFAKKYNAGIKYAAYSADTFKVDTDRLWIWLGTKF